jgi:hypothetical protein
MTLLDTTENIEILASQSLHYDRYSECRYFLERIDVHGKCGLACGEELEDYGAHVRVLLAPVYDRIEIRKISSQKASYDKYAVFADGNSIGQFTLVLNAWVPRA